MNYGCVEMNNLSLKTFKNPPSQYRTSPFWSWNDRLEPQELRRQVREFCDKGFGGYFMHSRVGLRTEYLSEEWFKMIRACLEEGRKHKLESWMYDEDKWPSGFAGGIVPAEDDSYRSRFLLCCSLAQCKLRDIWSDSGTVAVFSIGKGQDGSFSFRRLSKNQPIQEKDNVWVFRRIIAGKSNWYNGETYVDLMNPLATEAFLKITYDAYAGHFKNDFGAFMPGIFTDEPNYIQGNPGLLATTQGVILPWTDELPAYFSKTNGYDLVENLPMLVWGGKGAEKIRFDFHRTLTKRFLESWTIPCFRRCEKYGLKWTGHFLEEDTLESQIRCIGAAMPHYEYMHVPGIDHLGRNIYNPLTLKQCSSVAHQFGRKRVLCEIFGCSGHLMTFEDQKWIADFHFVLGITFLCQHLVLYNMTGDRKRDYPPTISYHQPYWKYYRVINDYFGRAGYILQQGDFAGDILLLHNIGSAWADFDYHLPSAKNTGHSKKWNDELVSLMHNLLELHRGFDFGDEMVMSKNTRLDSCGEIRVGTAGRYSLVIVPPSKTWSRSTIDLLRRFLSSGGRILFVGTVPSMVDGEPDEKTWREILSHPGVKRCRNSKSAIEKTLKLIHRRRVSITDGTGREISDIYVHERSVGRPARYIYFLSNRNRKKGFKTFIRVPVAGSVEKWDMAKGTVETLPALVSKAGTEITLDIPCTGSAAIVVAPSAKPHTAKVTKTTKTKKVARLTGPWKHRQLHPNALTLDFVRYSFNSEPWQGPVPVHKVRTEAFNHAGLEKYAGIQPWVLEKKGVKPGIDLKIDMRFEFNSELEKMKNIFVVVEKAGQYNIKVNNHSVETATPQWQWDMRFSKLDISGYVVKGKNIIELSGRYNPDMEIEDVYIVGDFGVCRTRAGFALTNEPAFLKPGNWVEQGYPFYAGNMLYSAEIELPAMSADKRVVVRLNQPRGTLFCAGLNGHLRKPIAWQEKDGWTLDLTDEARTGKNLIEIEVVGTLRNAFGPLHNTNGDNPGWVGPYEFVDPARWTDQYQFVPYGLLGSVEIEYAELRK